MEQVVDILAEVDPNVRELFDDEGITDFDTFDDLKEADFIRLRMKTKLIKKIQRLQKQLKENKKVEKLEPENNEKDAAEIWTPKQDNAGVKIVHQENSDSIAHPHAGVLLEQEINVDQIFCQTRAGKTVMEILKENEKKKEKPTDVFLKTIKNVLCDYLESTYGLRPTPYHKNTLAVSLVKTYPTLASSSESVPQSLWFHPHASGPNKHTGRLHYHMEYRVRKSDDRLIRRQKKVVIAGDMSVSDTSTPSEDQTDQIEQMREELKFICPGPATKARAEELWLATFKDRQLIRQTDTLLDYLKDHPVGSAFNGELISTEFNLLNPESLSFIEKFATIQDRILTEYKDQYKHITNDFLRALAIVRLKNPSRGAKRFRDSNAANENPLQGVMEWYQDDVLRPSKEVPVLQFRGGAYTDNCDGYIVWKDWSMCVHGDYDYCFQVLVECYAVLNINWRPSDKQFFLFVAALVGVGTLTTTGEKFMHRIK